MPEKSALSQRVQVGVETTPGTAVAANKLLQSLSIKPGAKVEIDSFRPAGSKWPTLTVLNKEWVEAGIEGKPTYDEIVYLLSSVLDVATITTPVGATTARLWTFDPSSSSDDAPKTYTVEVGASGATDGVQFDAGIVTGIELSASRDSVEVSGSMLGSAMVTGHTMTAAPTALPLFPIQPGQVCVYLDTTSAALGSTRLTRAFTVNISVDDRHSPVWALDCTQAGYAATVEGEPSGEVTLLMAFDAAGIGQVAKYRAGDTQFMRLEATGAEVDSGVAITKRRLTWDVALKCTDVGEFSDEDGIYAIEYTFAIVHDATWGRAMKVEVVNSTAAL